MANHSRLLIKNHILAIKSVFEIKNIIEDCRIESGLSIWKSSVIPLGLYMYYIWVNMKKSEGERLSNPVSEYIAKRPTLSSPTNAA